MIVLTCEQGSREWDEARLGIPTASQFSRIVTPGGAPSKSAEDYMGELLAEHFLGYPAKAFESEWADRGKALEPEARRYYAFHRDVDARTVGFCYRTARDVFGPDPNGLVTSMTSPDESVVGTSPDGLVGDDGLLELKCPMPGRHLVYLARGVLPKAYVMQVQGQLWVTGRAWVDFMSYCPDLPPFIVRVAPDPKMQDALDAAIPAFVDTMLEARARLSADYGLQPWNAGEPSDPTVPPCTDAGGHVWMEGWCVHCRHEREPAPVEAVMP